jgi:hypothetical protein
MIYTLTNPITVGDLNHSIIIDALQVESLSITCNQQKPVLSVILVHPASGYQLNVVYTDATALAFWDAVNSGSVLERATFERLMKDNKLPQGTLS